MKKYRTNYEPHGCHKCGVETTMLSYCPKCYIFTVGIPYMPTRREILPFPGDQAPSPLYRRHADDHKL